MSEGRPLWGPVGAGPVGTGPVEAAAPVVGAPPLPPVPDAPSVPPPVPDAQTGPIPVVSEFGIAGTTPDTHVGGPSSTDVNPYLTAGHGGDLYQPAHTVVAPFPGPIPPRYDGPSGPVVPSGPSGGGRHRIAVVAVVVAAAMLLAGGGVVFAMNRVGSGSPTPPVGQASVAPQPVPQTTAVAAPDPGLRSVSGLVAVDPAAATHPETATVLALLDRHFTAINGGDWTSWSETVVARRAEDQPRDRWTEDYRSTRDSDVRVGSITGADEGVLVQLQFVSEQDPSDAPPDLPVSRICWTSTWPVIDLDTGGAIGTPARGSTTKRAC